MRRVVADLATELDASYSSPVFDVLGERGFEHCVLPKEIEPLGLDRVMENLSFGEAAIAPGDYSSETSMGSYASQRRSSPT